MGYYVIKAKNHLDLLEWRSSFLSLLQITLQILQEIRMTLASGIGVDTGARAKLWMQRNGAVSKIMLPFWDIKLVTSRVLIAEEKWPMLGEHRT